MAGGTLIERLLVEIEGDADGLNTAFTAGQRAAKSFTQKLKDDLALANAEIKRSAAAGLISPQEAAKQGEAAGRAFREKVDAELKRVGTVQGPLTAGDARGRASYVAALTAELQSVAPASADAARGFAALTQAASQVPGPIGALATKLQQFAPGGGVTTAIVAGAGIAAVALAGIAVESLRMGVQLEQGARRISASLGVPVAQLGALRDSARSFSEQFGVAQTDVLALMNAVAQGGAGGADGVRQLTEAALELAAATGGDRGGLAAGLDQVSDAFGILPDRARDVAAALFGVGQGRVPIEDLLDVFQRLAPAAQASHIAFETLASAATQLLDQGFSIKQASTRLQELAEKGADGRREIERLAGALPNASENLGKLQTAAETAVSPIDQATEAMHNLVASFASTEAVSSFTRVIRELAAEMGTGIPAAAARMTENLDAIERGLNRGNTPFFGRQLAKNQAEALVTEVRANPQALERIDDQGLEHARALIGRLRTETTLTKDGLREMALLLNKIDGEIQRREHAPPVAPLASGTPKAVLDPEAAEKAKTAAEKATSELAAFVQQVAQITASATADQIDDIDAKLAKLAADAAKARKEIAEGIKSPKARQAALDTLDTNDARAKAALEQQRADAVVARREAEELQRRAAQVQQQIDTSTALADAKLARVRNGVADIQASAEVLTGGLINLSQDQIDGLLAYQDTLRDVIADEHTANDERERAKALLAEVQGLLHGVEPQVAASAKHAHDWADGLARGARALVEALQVAGTLDGKMASIATSAITLAESLSAAIKSKGADVGADIAAVASLINIGKGLFGKSDAEKAHERQIEATTRALAALAKQAGDLASLSISGRAFGGVRSAIDSIVGQTAASRGSTHVKGLDGIFDALGISGSDVDAVAKQLNVTLDGTVESFRQLATAIHAADYQAFADSWSGILADMETLNQVDGISDPLGQLQSFMAALGKSGSSVFGSILAANFDVSTGEGREALRAAARSWLDQFRQGLVDPATLGKLTPQEFLDAMKTLIGDIDAVGVAADGASSGVDALTASMNTLHARLSDIALLGDLVGHSAEDIFKSLDSLVAAFPQFANEIAATVRGVDFATEEGRERFKQNVASLATRFAEGGLTEAERGVLQTLLDIEHSVDALGTATATATGAVDSLSGATQAFGETAASISQRLLGEVAQAKEDARRLGKTEGEQDQLVADAFGQRLPGLGSIDVRDPRAVAQGLDILRKQYGSTDPNDLANHDLIGGAIDFLMQLPAAVTDAVSTAVRQAGGPSTVTADVERITSTEAGRLGDLAAAQTALLRESLVVQQGIAATLAQMAAAAAGSIVPPYTPQIAGGGRGAPIVLSGGGNVTITLGDVSIALGEVVTGATDGRSLLAELAALSGAEVARAFGPALQDALRRLLVGQLPTSRRFA